MAAQLDMSTRLRSSWSSIKLRASTSFKRFRAAFKSKTEEEEVAEALPHHSGLATPTPTTTNTHLCRSKLVEFEQRWTIENARVYFDDCFVGPPIVYSLDFGPPPLAMHLNLKTRSSVDRQFMSLFLNWNVGGGGAPAGHCLIFKFSIIGVDGERKHSRASIKHFGPNDRSWGWNNFLRVATLLDPAAGLLVNGSLTILCEVKQLECIKADPPSPPTPTTPSPPTADFTHWKTDLYRSGKLTDVTVVLSGGVSLRAHKLVLAFGSPVFAAMFEHDFAEKLASHVELPDVRLEVFRAMLDWIYTGQLGEQLGELAEELLIAADKYQMDGLKQHCEQWLASSLSIENAEHLYQLATVYNADQLAGAVAGWARANIQQSIQSLDAGDPVLALKTAKCLHRLAVAGGGSTD